MNEEKEFINKIRKSAENIPVPESLSPENIENKLKKPRRHSRIYVAAACLLCLLVGGVSYRMIASDPSLSGNRSADCISRPMKQETSYDELYSIINNYNKQNQVFEIEDTVENFVDKSQASGASEDVDKSKTNGTASSASSDFTDTDVQVDGVMEGDIVKTDGKHIFAALESTAGAGISIYNVDGEKTELISNIFLKECDLEEMYLDGNKIIFLSRKWDEGQTTIIDVYDISDIKSPNRTSHLTQDGSYQTSRFVDGYLYTFSSYTVFDSNLKKKDRKSYIPKINGSDLIRYYDIDLLCEDKANSYLVISSINLQITPENFSDVMALFGYSDISYVSNNNIYIAMTDTSDYEKTQLIKYRYEKGVIHYVCDTKFRGRLHNSYSLHEYKDNLAVVYTTNGKFSSKSKNGLCIFDKDLKLTGEIGNLGINERIYSSYFIDHMAYFVTYRNTDPVFAVDISNPNKPELKSELKLPGFSDYLHSFGKDKLLGIGKDDKFHVKLSLFDIKSNYELTESYNKSLTGFESCLAGSNHKAVLVDEQNGLIGLGVQKWDDIGGVKDNNQYFLFQYGADGKLHKVFNHVLKGNIDNTRGLRIGSYFYIVDAENGITVKKLDAFESTPTEGVSKSNTPVIKVDGKIYISTGKKSTVTSRCGNMDGTIESSIPQNQIPMKDNESNFGTGYGYQFGPVDNTIEVYMNDDWWVFEEE